MLYRKQQTKYKKNTTESLHLDVKQKQTKYTDLLLTQRKPKNCYNATGGAISYYHETMTGLDKVFVDCV